MYEFRKSEKELRTVFRDTLRSLMEQNRDVVYLEADLAGAIGTGCLFSEFPEQAFDVGIMEANMVGVAAGMSLKGKIPFTHTFGPFASRRCADQVFMAGCYNHANVKMIGSDPGVSAEANGGTHMPFEDVGVFRTFPGMTILDVAEPAQLQAVLEQAAAIYGMMYIRFPRKGNVAWYLPEQTFTIGKGITVRDGADVTIAASGVEVEAALRAAEELAGEGVDARVVDLFTIKPLDEELLLSCCRETGAVVSAENHNVIGGLGSAVAEVIAEKGHVPFRRIGVPDCFGEVGDKQFLSEKFGITKEHIAQAVREVLKEK